MFLSQINFLITVFFGLSTFVVITNSCSSQFAKNNNLDYISCNDCNQDIMIESIEPTNHQNLDIITKSSSAIAFASLDVNKNFTINFFSKDQNNKLTNLRNEGQRDLSLKKILKTHGQKCSHYFDLLFCLNGGKCLKYVIGDASVFSCECAEGYYGERCDFKYTLYDNAAYSNVATFPLSIASKCEPDFDLQFCLNGGKCFNYPIGNSFIMSCICAEGYYGERCDFKYIAPEKKTISYNYYSKQNHHNGHIIRRAKVYITPFIVGIIIAMVLYIIISTKFPDVIQAKKK